jgi:rubredoxin
MKYKCSVCGYVHDEDKEGPFEELEKCPLCNAPVNMFKPIEDE